jgi:serine protease Do
MNPSLRRIAIGAVALGLASAVLRAAPESPPAPAEPGWLGVWLENAIDGGVQIVAVWPGGPADKGGIRPGDVLLEAGGAAVVDLEDLGRVVAVRGAGQVLPIVVVRGSEEVRSSVLLGARQPMAIPPGMIDHPVAPIAPLAPIARVAPTPGAPADPVGLEVEEITPALRVHLGAPATSGVLVTRIESVDLPRRPGSAWAT